jgi:hypothetical protein
MAYDEKLAQRMRTILDELQPSQLIEKKMFGGLAFMVRGSLACGTLGDGIIVRVPPDEHTELLMQKHVRPFDLTGRPMKGWLVVTAEGCKTKAALKKWVQTGVTFALSLPAKK